MRSAKGLQKVCKTKKTGVACLPEVRELTCPWCEIKTNYNEKHGFYRCPDCGGEWWPDKQADVYIGGRSSLGIFDQEIRDKKRICKKGGGSKVSGRKKKNVNSLPPNDRYRIY
jgi:hypothetical protein